MGTLRGLLTFHYIYREKPEKKVIPYTPHSEICHEFHLCQYAINIHFLISFEGVQRRRLPHLTNTIQSTPAVFILGRLRDVTVDWSALMSKNIEELGYFYTTHIPILSHSDSFPSTHSPRLVPIPFISLPLCSQSFPPLPILPSVTCSWSLV